MKKTSKKTVRNSMRSYMDPPDVANMDDLSYATDDELENRAAYMFSERDKAASVDVDTRPWEEEISYVQREMRIRLARRTAHEKYMRSNPEGVIMSSSDEDHINYAN